MAQQRTSVESHVLPEKGISVPLHPDHCLTPAATAAFAHRDDGVGLAAPQIGVNVRLMVFNETARPGAQEEVVLVNPSIIEKGKATDIDVEGCLSFPGIYADVEVRGGEEFGWLEFWESVGWSCGWVLPEEVQQHRTSIDSSPARTCKSHATLS